MQVTTKFIIICREAFLEAGTNNLNLIRIFSQVQASSFPHILPAFALVVNFDIDTAGSHTLRTDVVSPDGKIAAHTELPVTTNVGNWQVIANFEQFKVSAPGIYTFRINLDDAALGERTLEIRPANSLKTTTKPALA